MRIMLWTVLYPYQKTSAVRKYSCLPSSGKTCTSRFQ